MTAKAEDVLGRALQDLPVGVHAPIARIEQRASQLRRRRRAVILAGTAIAAVAVAAAFMTGVADRLDLGPANPPTPCPTADSDVPDIQWIPDRLPPRMCRTRCACCGQSRLPRRRRQWSPRT